MIKKVTYLQNAKGFNPNAKQGKDFEGFSTVPQETKPVVKYSSENIKANYVSFTGGDAAADMAQRVGSKADGGLVSLGYNPTAYTQAFRDFSKRPDRELVSGRYYDATADEVITALGPDKNIMLVHEETVSPDLLIHNMVKNVRDGRYNASKYMAGNTDILTFDPREMHVNPASSDSLSEIILKNLSVISHRDPQREKIIFVKHFDDFLSGLRLDGDDYEHVFNKDTFEHLLPNTHIVGLVPQDELKPKTMEEIMNGEKPKFNPKKLKYVRKVELSGLGANATKKLLNDDIRFIKSVLGKHDKARFDIEPEVLDMIVDNTAYKYAGTFPKKALDVLDLMASSAVTDSRSDGWEPVKIHLTKESAKDFFENKSSLIKYMKMDESVFSFSENVTTKLSDVGGVTEAKEEMAKIVRFIKNPKEYLESFPMMDPPKGAILEGPTGTGKTLLARAVAGEVDAPFSSMSAAELLKKYIGEGEEAVREWFKKLDQAATDSGKGVAVGFIDEIDAIGTIRSSNPDAGSEAKASILNQLLTLIDGFNNKEAKNKIILIAATNRADMLDPALKRAGRFDKVITVGAAETLKETMEILKVHTKKLPFESEAAKDEILDELALLMKGSSGAEIKKVIDLTKEVVSERPENRVVTFNDTFEAVLRSFAGKKRASEIPAEEKRLITIHEAGHALVRDFFDMPLTAVSNEERGSFGGVTIHPDSKEMPNFINVIKELAAKSAGGDAEALYYPHGHNAGVSKDLEQATAIIKTAIMNWGLGINVPQINLSKNPNYEELYKAETKLDTEIFLNTRETVSKKIMNFCKPFLDEVYLKRYDKEMAEGKGGNVYSGKQIRAMREAWLDSTGRRASFDALKAEMEKFIVDAQKSGKKVVETAVEKTAKASSHFKPIAFVAAGSAAVAAMVYAGMSAHNYKKFNEAKNSAPAQTEKVA